MLRSNSKILGNHVVSPEEEKERLQWEELPISIGFVTSAVWLPTEWHHPCFRTLWNELG